MDEETQDNHDNEVGRQVNQQRYLKDYVMQSKKTACLFQQASEECERLLLSINNEPRFYKEAIDVFQWRKACKKEIDSINKNETWFLVDKPSEVKAIDLKWRFINLNVWEIRHLDGKTTFLHGELKEDVYVDQPEGFEVKGEEHKVYKLSKALYGLRKGP